VLICNVKVGAWGGHLKILKLVCDLAWMHVQQHAQLLQMGLLL
jgi:hypothetical protein